MAGAVTLAEVLESNRVLENLILNNCDIGDDGVQQISQGRCPTPYTTTMGDLRKGV